MNNAEMDFPSVSVVIPVWNDADRLVRCLTSLFSQNYPPEKLEVLVVDNNSTQPLFGVKKLFPKAKFLECKKPGCAAARNVGISHATSDVLAFTDSDCVPDSGWIFHGVYALASGDRKTFVGGKIDIVLPEASSRWTYLQIYDRAFHLEQYWLIKEHRFACHANFFAYRDEFLRVGLLEEDSGVIEDQIWAFRALVAGWKAVYACDAQIKHPANANFAEFYGRIRRYVLDRRCLKKSQTLMDRKKSPLSHWRGICHIKTRLKERGICVPIWILCLVSAYVGAVSFYEALRLKMGFSASGYADRGHHRLA